MDLNAEHFKTISDEIALDYNKMLAERSKGQALCYLDPKFCYLDSKHNVENMILVGWLLCKHWSDETQATELWHIINPTLLPVVSKKQVIAVIRKLMYVAIDMNLNMINSLPESPSKTNALKYHKKIAAGREKFIA